MAKKEARDREKGSIFGKLWERFGEVAKSLGLAQESDVSAALDHQEARRAARAPHKKIGQILVEKGKLTEDHVAEVLSHQRKDKAKAKAAAKPKKEARPKAAKKKAAKKPKKKSVKKVKKSGKE